MKTSTILIIIILIMQLMTLVHVTIFKGEWGGLILMFSFILSIAATAVYGISRQQAKQT